MINAEAYQTAPAAIMGRAIVAGEEYLIVLPALDAAVARALE